MSTLSWLADHWDILLKESIVNHVKHPYLKQECRGPHERGLCQKCGWIHDYCWRSIEDCPSRGSGPINSRSLPTKMVLWLEDRHHELKPGNLVLVKADAFKGKRKIRDRWEEETYEVVHQIVTDILSYEVMDQCGRSCILHQKLASSHYIRGWHSLVYRCPSCKGQMYQPHPMQAHFQGKWGYDDATRSSGWAVTQCLASKTSLGWINGKLWLLPWTSTRASTDDGWRFKVMCSGCRHLKEHICLAEGMMSLPVDITGWWTPWLTQLLIVSFSVLLSCTKDRRSDCWSDKMHLGYEHLLAPWLWVILRVIWGGKIAALLAKFLTCC